MNKGTTNISDLRSYFSESENNRGINAIVRDMECWGTDIGHHLGNPEITSADASELLSAVIDGNPKFHMLIQIYKSVA